MSANNWVKKVPMLRRPWDHFKYDLIDGKMVLRPNQHPNEAEVVNLGFEWVMPYGLNPLSANDHLWNKKRQIMMERTRAEASRQGRSVKFLAQWRADVSNSFVDNEWKYLPKPEWILTQPVEAFIEMAKPWVDAGYKIESHENWDKNHYEYLLNSIPAGRVPEFWGVKDRDNKKLKLYAVCFDMRKDDYLDFMVGHAAYCLKTFKLDALQVSTKVGIFHTKHPNLVTPTSSRTKGPLYKTAYKPGEWKKAHTKLIQKLHDDLGTMPFLAVEGNFNEAFKGNTVMEQFTQGIISPHARFENIQSQSLKWTEVVDPIEFDDPLEN